MDALSPASNIRIYMEVWATECLRRPNHINQKLAGLRIELNR
jgi:hypothetical protein